MPSIVSASFADWVLDPSSVIRVSVTADGTQGDSASGGADISADGRFVVFHSDATNLAAGDTNSALDVFLKDLTTGDLLRISTDSEAAQGVAFSYSPSISADSRYVVFESAADNLVSGDTNGREDIFLRDGETGEISRLSTATGGAQADFYSVDPEISANGLFATFYSAASNLVSGDVNGTLDVFLRDIASETTTRISVSSDEIGANGRSTNASISADGSKVAFFSDATNLVADDTNSRHDIFLRDVAAGTTVRVSTASDGTQGNAQSRNPEISADGRYVVFESDASNLVSSDTNFTSDIFLKDRSTGVTTRVSTAADGAQANGYSSSASISSDGRYVVFLSDSDNLVQGGDSNLNAYLKDNLTGLVTLLSASAAGVQADRATHEPSISPDGRFVTFTGYAASLVSGDTNTQGDVFRVDVTAAVERQGASLNRLVRLDLGTADATEVTAEWGDNAVDIVEPASDVSRLSHVYAVDGTYNTTITADDGAENTSEREYEVLVAAAPTSAQVLDGTAGFDTAGFDVVLAGQGSDTIATGADDDIVKAFQGDDRLTGGAGADQLDGGSGIDTAVYSGSAAVKVDLAAGTGTGGEAEGDRLRNVENLIGSADADSLSGDAAANRIEGGAGGDMLAGRAGGDRFAYSVAGDEDGDDIDGGGETDALVIAAAGTYDFRAASTTGVEELRFETGGATARFAATSMSGVTDFIGSAGTDRVEAMGTGGVDAIDLSALQFGAWNDAVDVFRIEGGAAADTIEGTSRIDEIDGGEGDDTLVFTYLTDKHQGGEGTDTLLLNSDQFYGAPQNIDGMEVLKFGTASYAGINASQFAGYTQFKTLAGSALTNTLQVSTGAGGTADLSGVTSFQNWSSNDVVLIQGRASSDQLTGTGVADTVDGYDGNDILNGRGAADRLVGGQGSDLFRFRIGDVTAGEVIAGAQVDGSGDQPGDSDTLALAGTVNFNLASLSNIDEVLFEGAGTANLLASQLRAGRIAVDAAVTGSAGVNTVSVAMAANGGLSLAELSFLNWEATDRIIINASSGDETITGSVVDDEANLGDGDDTIRTGAGDDSVLGGEGDDTILTGSGSDRADGSGGADAINTGSGDDSIVASLGDDALNGGSGIDLLDLSMLSGGVALSLLERRLVLSDGVTEQSVVAVERATGTASADTLRGNGLANVFVGNGGNDTLEGAAGADELRGGLGKDTITGGLGADILSGYLGADTFRFNSTSEGGDTISDFARSGTAALSDHLAFAKAGFGNIAAVTSTNFVDNLSGAATTSAHRFIFETDTKILRYDSDGLGGAAAVEIATLNVASMSAADFLMV